MPSWNLGCSGSLAGMGLVELLLALERASYLLDCEVISTVDD